LRVVAVRILLGLPKWARHQQPGTARQLSHCVADHGWPARSVTTDVHSDGRPEKAVRDSGACGPHPSLHGGVCGPCGPFALLKLTTFHCRLTWPFERNGYLIDISRTSQ